MNCLFHPNKKAHIVIAGLFYGFYSEFKVGFCEYCESKLDQPTRSRIYQTLLEFYYPSEEWNTLTKTMLDDVNFWKTD